MNTETQFLTKPITEEPGPFLFVAGPGDGMRINVPEGKFMRINVPQPPLGPLNGCVTATTLKTEDYEASRWHAEQHEFTIFKPFKLPTPAVLRALIERYPKPNQMAIDVGTMEKALEVIAALKTKITSYSPETEVVLKDCTALGRQLGQSIREHRKLVDL